LVVEVVDTVIKDIRAVIYILQVHMFLENTFILATKCLMKLFVKTNAKFST